MAEEKVQSQNHSSKQPLKTEQFNFEDIGFKADPKPSDRVNFRTIALDAVSKPQIGEGFVPTRYKVTKKVNGVTIPEKHNTIGYGHYIEDENKYRSLLKDLGINDDPDNLSEPSARKLLEHDYDVRREEMGRKYKYADPEILDIMTNKRFQYSPGGFDNKFGEYIRNDDVLGLVSALDKEANERAKIGQGGFTHRNTEIKRHLRLYGKELQKDLIKKGYDVGAVDGIIGQKTKGAVKQFQKDTGLSPDGKVGPKTKKNLLSMLGDMVMPSAYADEIPTDFDWESIGFVPDPQPGQAKEEPFDFEAIGFVPDEVSQIEPKKNIAQAGIESLFKIKDLVATKGMSALNKVVNELPAASLEDIRESFKRGEASATIDQASYRALIGELDFDKDVQPLKEAQNAIATADPIKGKNAISSAIYAVSSMSPALMSGMAQGAGVGAGAGLLTLAGGATAPLALGAFGVGQAYGSFDYWRKQGAGQLYADLKYKEIPDEVAKPTAHIAGALYGAVEFSQADKLIPGFKDLSKRYLSDSIQKTVARMVAVYGVNWVQEVGEEGLQAVVMSAAEETASKIADKSDKSNAKIVKDVIIKGWDEAKESALPLLLLMAPRAAMEGVALTTEVKGESIKSEVRKAMAQKVIEQIKSEEKETAKLEDVSTDVAKPPETFSVNVTPEMEGAVDSGLPAIEIKEVETALEKSNLPEERRSEIIRRLEATEPIADTKEEKPTTDAVKEESSVTEDDYKSAAERIKGKLKPAEPVAEPAVTSQAEPVKEEKGMKESPFASEGLIYGLKEQSERFRSEGKIELADEYQRKYEKELERRKQYLIDKLNEQPQQAIDEPKPEQTAEPKPQSQLTQEFNEMKKGQEKPVQKQEPGVDVEVMANDLAKRLNQKPQEFHKKFAQDIIDKNVPEITKWIAQGKGANETMKKFFSDVTGVKLPTTVSGKKDAIELWSKGEKYEDKSQTIHYYGKDGYTSIKAEPVIFEGFENYKFFIHKSPTVKKGQVREFVITEATSGLSVDRAYSREGTIESAKEKLNRHKDKLDAVIKDAIDKHGVSPSFKGSAVKEPVKAPVNTPEVKTEYVKKPVEETLPNVSESAILKSEEVPNGDATEPAVSETVSTGGRPEVAGGQTAEGPGVPRRSGATEPARNNEGVDSGVSGQDREGSGNYVITEADEIGKGGDAAKYKNNIAAIKLLKKIQSESRQATKEEQAVLVKYVGWGGLKSAFDQYNDKWSKQYKELKDLLTKEEYDAAKRSVLNAHYTSPEIIKAIWTAVGNMGFNRGTVLEPSSGVGHFIGLAPHADKKFSLVELDNITGGIASLLYPDANTQVTGLQEAAIPQNYFGMAISNVPFSEVQPYDAKAKAQGIPAGLVLHDYFFAKSLIAVKPGGLIAFVTSKGTMDKRDSDFRAWINKRAKFLGAIRLPSDAFKENAGTEVVTDIIFLQKLKEGEKEDNLDFVTTGNFEEGSNYATVNNYFLKNKKQVLGKMEFTGGMYRGDSLNVRSTGDFNKKLAEAIDRLPKDIYQSVNVDAAKNDDIQDHTVVKEDAFVVKDKKVYQKVNGKLEEKKLEVMDVDRVAGLIGIRDAYRDLLKDERLNADTIEAKREALNSLYDKFVEKFGYLNEDKNIDIIDEDPDAALVSSLEDIQKLSSKKMSYKKMSYKKRPIFSERQNSKHVRPTKASSPEVALKISLAEDGYINLKYISELLGITESKGQETLLKDGYIYKDPNGDRIVIKDEYLSGNVKKKLAEASEAAKIDQDFQRNVDALTPKIPVDKTFDQIDFDFGTPWIEANTYQSFLRSIGIPMRVNYLPQSGQFEVEASDYAYNRDEWGVPNFDYKRLIEYSLNAKPIKVTRPAGRDESGKPVREPDPENTELAIIKAETLKSKFRSWFWEEDTRRDKYVQWFNDNMNHTIDREYDGTHQTFPGLVPTALPGPLRSTQINAIWRVVIEARTMLAHAVGAGKTAIMIASAMEAKRLGIVKKTAMVVLKPTLVQFKNTINAMYPGAKVLVANKENFNKQDRKKFLAKAAAGDWDIIVMTHNNLIEIPSSPEVVKKYIQQEIDELNEAMEDARRSPDSNITVRRMEAMLLSLNEKLKESTDQEGKLDTLYFDELGIDSIYVDEAHEFKNLPYASATGGIKGMGNPTGSSQARDMKIKTDAIRMRGGKIVFATATPISNSIVEAYSMMKYLQPEVMKQEGIHSFDAWMKTYARAESAPEVDVTGGQYRVVTRLKNFQNLESLRRLAGRVWDIQTKKMLLKSGVLKRGKGGNLPKIKPGVDFNGNANPDFEDIKIAPTRELLEYTQVLIDRDKEIRQRKGKPEKGDDILLTVMQDGIKASIDMRMIDPSLPKNKNSKVEQALDILESEYRKYNDVKGTQIVFIDKPAPDEDAQWNPQTYMKKELIARGIPEKEILFIHDFKSDSAREKLYDMMNSGEGRILFGSSDLVGTGLNVQERMVAGIHLGIPGEYKPSQIIQREGRVDRPGNKMEEVRLIRLIQEGGLDGFVYQLLEAKEAGTEAFLEGKVFTNVTEGEVNPYETGKILASSNPMVKEKADVDREIRSLGYAKTAYLKQREEARPQIKFYQETIEDSEKNISTIKTFIDKTKTIEKPTAETFRINVNGKEFDTKKEAHAAIYENYGSIQLGDKKTVKVGTYLGMDLLIRKELIRDRVHNYIGFNIGDGIMVESEFSQDPVGTFASLDYRVFDGVKGALKFEEDRLQSATASLSSKENLLASKFEEDSKLDALLKKQKELEIALRADVEGKKVEQAKPNVAAGDENVIVTKDEYTAANKRISSKLNRLSANPMLDPELWADLLKVGTFHLERGARTFAAWSDRMVGEFGESIRPHLDNIWKSITPEVRAEEPVQATVMAPQGDKVAKAASDINRKIVNRGMAEVQDDDLASYASISKAEQLEMAAQLLTNDPEGAKAMAFGQKPMPAGISPQVVFNAVKNKAMMDGDAQTIRALAQSPVATERSLLAQKLGAAGYDNGMTDADPIKAINEISKVREANNAEANKKVAELEAKLAEAERKLSEAVSKQATRSRTRTDFGSRNVIFKKEGLDQARESLRKKLGIGTLRAGIDPTALAEVTQIGGYYFEGGMREFASWSAEMMKEFGIKIEPYLKPAWDDIKRTIANAKRDVVISKVMSGIAGGESFSNLSMSIQPLAEYLVSEGVDTRDELVDRIHELFLEAGQDISKRDIADAVSGYGQFKPLKDDEIKAKLRDIKGQLQQVSKIEDLQKKIAPAKTGVERRTPSDEERRLIKQVEELKKQSGIVSLDPTRQLKTALDAVKTRLNNQIKDLERQIADRQRIVKDKRTIELDKEAKDLTTRRDELKREFDAIFSKPGMTDQQRLEIATRAVVRSINILENKIKTGDIEIKKPKPGVTSPQLEALKARREALKADLQELRDIANPPRSEMEKAIDAVRSRLIAQQKKLEKQLADNDFTKSQRPAVPETPDIMAARENLERVKAAHSAAKSVAGGVTDAELQTIVGMGKAVYDAKDKMNEDFTWNNKQDGIDFGAANVAFKKYVAKLKRDAEGSGLVNIMEGKSASDKYKRAMQDFRVIFNFIADNTKSMLGSLDNSFFGRQGLPALLNPKYKKAWADSFIRSWESIWKTVKGNIGSTSAINAILGKDAIDAGNAIEDAVVAEAYSRKNYLNGRYNKGVRLDIATGEEAFPTSLPEMIPLFGRLFKASNVSFGTSAMRLRMDIADMLYDLAEKSGQDMNDKQVIGDINQIANELTGRGGLGRMGGSKFINRTFFSIKFAKSRIDFLLRPFYPNQSEFARKEAAKNLLFTAGALAIILALAKAFDDDSTDFDPRGDLFGKIKLGNGAVIDITGGLSGFVILASRVFIPTMHDGKFALWTKNSKTGVYTRLGESFGSPDGADMLVNFATNKLSPIAGAMRDYLRQRNFDNKKPTFTSTAAGLITPIPTQNIIELSSKEEDNAVKLAAIILDGLGAGMSYRDMSQDWEGKTSKEMVEFKLRVGDDRFKQANDRYNKIVNEHIDNVLKSDRYKDLDDDQKRRVIENEKENIKDRVLLQYGFKYKNKKLTPVPKF